MATDHSPAPLHSAVVFDCEVQKLSSKALDLNLCERRKLNVIRNNQIAPAKTHAKLVS